MPTRFTKVDDLTRGDHFFIRPEDECFHLGEYISRAGYSGATNDLIQNLKKPMDRQGRPEWRWKEWAIDRCAAMLRESFGGSGFGSGTVIPVPPSKAKTDPAYDDRLSQILQKASAQLNSDVREMVTQINTIGAAHDGDRVPIHELIENYQFDAAMLGPLRQGRAFIFDDVLTTGRHFRAMKEKILEQYPNARVTGIFMARRKIPVIES
jgi:hypothetical protein